MKKKSKIMKFVLAGALALGVVGVGAATIHTEQASASSIPSDWTGHIETDLALTVAPELAKSSYSYGDRYSFTKYATWRENPMHVKIYRVNADRTLQRYKTIEPDQVFNDGTSYIYEFNTTITTGFVPGQYYAVYTQSEELISANGPVMVESAVRSYRFTIQ